nr:MAG TPA: hypothetical protein [Caudoviricetes sp.]
MDFVFAYLSGKTSLLQHSHSNQPLVSSRYKFLFSVPHNGHFTLYVIVL